MSKQPLRIPGHALEHSRSGVQSLTAVGRCKCGAWRATSTDRLGVTIKYRSHLAAIAKAKS
jgi:hypothetical protein